VCSRYTREAPKTSVGYIACHLITNNGHSLPHTAPLVTHGPFKGGRILHTLDRGLARTRSPNPNHTYHPNTPKDTPFPYRIAHHHSVLQVTGGTHTKHPLPFAACVPTTRPPIQATRPICTGPATSMAQLPWPTHSLPPPSTPQPPHGTPHTTRGIYAGPPPTCFEEVNSVSGHRVVAGCVEGGWGGGCGGPRCHTGRHNQQKENKSGCLHRVVSIQRYNVAMPPGPLTQTQYNQTVGAPCTVLTTYSFHPHVCYLHSYKPTH